MNLGIGERNRYSLDQHQIPGMNLSRQVRTHVQQQHQGRATWTFASLFAPLIRPFVSTFMEECGQEGRRRTQEMGSQGTRKTHDFKFQKVYVRLRSPEVTVRFGWGHASHSICSAVRYPSGGMTGIIVRVDEILRSSFASTEVIWMRQKQCVNLQAHL